ncbi:hypothetical protein B0H15DRAFT_97675 [Mycena belliarum]|uniref:Uncharacterized protein n=1 Tax=Mycena belliarum TaxID=1033014 RepID=A0AAD6UAQ1_9AGAR|nr:hypothetical protein B0H15DRAFT_97675 [Mycena belliae]
MTTLPSFVELMASLGLDTVDRSPSPRSSPASSPRVPSVTPPSPTKSRSSPSLRDTPASRNRLARYSPYSPVFQLSSRRGSLSSNSSNSSDYERPTVRAYSTSPHPPSSPRSRKRHGNNNLSVNVYGSNSDLSANTPISTYVRRKTPGASPTSPTFPREAYDSPSSSPMPFSIPTLPPLFPRSASSDSFPLTPNSDSGGVESGHSSPNMNYPAKALPEPDSATTFLHRGHHTGVRISAAPRLVDRHPRSRAVVHIAHA